jgi:subtilase family serine protease
MNTVRAACVLAAILIVSACSPTSGDGRTARVSSTPAQATPAAPTLAAAIRASTHLGPASGGTEVFLNFSLKTRQTARLAALLASGQTVSPTQYEAEFGPDPALVQAALRYLSTVGVQATWKPGSALIEADGPAPAVSALLRVDIERYRLADGTTFYASLDTPTIQAPLLAVVADVSGLDSYRRTRGYAVRPGGLRPTDVLAFYNLSPLRDRGLDGTGQTILFPEIESVPKANLDDLDKFATEFGLPPFGPLLTIKHDPSWGTPEKPGGEAVLDLEIAHEVAPKAKLVVYTAGPQFAFLDRAFNQLVTDNLGSIISESLGICEAESSSGHRDLYSSIQDRAVAQGMSHFVASGDNGAYTCGEDQPASASFPATLPSVTAVGGTTVFESTTGKYFKEAVWASPIDQTGTGGGPSQIYPTPDWQKAVQDANGHGFRQIPDVAADADPITGYHIVFGGEDTQIGGTSAATPLWAATIALVNQDLKKKGLRQVGFANPAIYWMGANQAKLPSPPFHDVTVGNNLAYSANPGWDFATGWGSMDADAMDTAWVTYIKGGGA